MPLGIFGGSGKDGGPKPQPLTSEEKTLKREKAAGSSNHSANEIKDAKGSTVKLWKKTYTVERKLAEGGFAIVYLVSDKHNKNYALKRQLIRDDARHVEACRTESQIVKNLSEHKNIIEYVDHQLTLNKAGVYDYMLLTVYYPENVLQLMNSRLLINKWLTHNEILEIFCDVCEAVARLHHSKTPVIHRDLKVENVLIDRRTRVERPLYVLCDFGSATTKVLSKDHYTHAFIEEEIQRYTTLGYRAPEMVDLFSGIPIDTKSDIWALGIFLYKLCYFTLPFGESALAIQSGLFTFPEVPQIPDSIKAMINLMLTQSAKHRPNIYQIAYLAFSASNQKCPVYNIEKSARIELNEAIQILHLRDKLGTNYSRLFEKAINDFEAQKRRHTIPTDGQPLANPPANDKNHPSTSSQHESDPANRHFTVNSTKTSYKPTEGVIVSTTKEMVEVHPRSATTSVNPRLRPKPQTISTSIKQAEIEMDIGIKKFDCNDETDSATKPSQLRIDQSEQTSLQKKTPENHQDAIMMPALPHFSAFQPYSLAKEKRAHATSMGQGDFMSESSNPFVQPTTSDLNMDDNLFGEHFDAMRRDRIFQDDESQDQDPDAISKPNEEKLTLEYEPLEEHRENIILQLPPRVHCDWEAIENQMGENPFKNAPNILPHQYLSHRRPLNFS